MGQTAGGVTSALYVHSSAHLSGQSEWFLTLMRRRWFYMLNWPKSCHKAIRATDSLSRRVRAFKLYNVLPCIFLPCSCSQHYKQFGVHDNNTSPEPQTTAYQFDKSTAGYVRVRRHIYDSLSVFSFPLFLFFFLPFVCLLGHSFYGIWWSVVKCLCNMFGEGWLALMPLYWSLTDVSVGRYISRYRPVTYTHCSWHICCQICIDMKTFDMTWELFIERI